MDRHARCMLVVLALLSGSGCHRAVLDRSVSVGSSDPSMRDTKGFRSEDVPVRGFNVVVVATGDRRLEGELLAAERLGLHLLEKGQVRVWVPRDEILQIEIEEWPSYALETGIWTALGSVATLTHGFFLILTAPLWLSLGIGTTVYAAGANDVGVPTGGDLTLLGQYARFPQGLPEGLPGGTSPKQDQPPTTPETAPAPPL